MTDTTEIRYFISDDGVIAPAWTSGTSTAEAHGSTVSVKRRLARQYNGEVGVVGLTREQYDKWENKTHTFDVLASLKNGSRR